MKKGTLTLINLSRVGPGSTSSFGSFVGLGQARRVSIFFQGSYGAYGGTPAQLDIYAAIRPNAGSIDTAALGSIVLATGANATKRRMKYIDTLEAFPYITAKVLHRTGTIGLQALAKAVVQFD